MSSATSFGFIEALPPHIEILGLSIEMQWAGAAAGLVVLPFALGVFSRKQPAWAALGLLAYLLTVGVQHAFLLYAGLKIPSPVQFPWGHVAEWMLWSIPAIVAGHLVARHFEKRGARPR